MQTKKYRLVSMRRLGKITHLWYGSTILNKVQAIAWRAYPGISVPHIRQKRGQRITDLPPPHSTSPTITSAHVPLILIADESILQSLMRSVKRSRWELGSALRGSYWRTDKYNHIGRKRQLPSFDSIPRHTRKATIRTRQDNTSPIQERHRRALCGL